MHASYVAILVLAASAASPALSAPLAPDPFQSVPTTNSLSSGGLSIADLNNINIVNKPDSPPAPAVGARSTVDDIATKVLQLFSGNIVARDPLAISDLRLHPISTIGVLGSTPEPTLDGLDSTQEVTRRQTSPFNSTFLQPIGSFDLEALMADLQNFQRDLASRSLKSLD
ncbi:hypothetical protein EDB87DRAFT_1577432 [Lactarius vividus]|nr:hypothetical protein EDB87DRAFT_1577432 [Lactarius vividus]